MPHKRLFPVKNGQVRFCPTRETDDLVFVLEGRGAHLLWRKIIGSGRSGKDRKACSLTFRLRKSVKWEGEQDLLDHHEWLFFQKFGRRVLVYLQVY